MSTGYYDEIIGLGCMKWVSTEEGYVCIAWSVYVGAERYEMRFWPT